MKLWQVRRHWDALARDDPYFAVLTKAGKEGGKWTVDDFYATGVSEVARDIARIRALEPGFVAGHALDFGCGAGRLTHALGLHVPKVTGVDISERMVALARSRGNGRVSFLVNPRPDLGVFPDGSFSLVYSRITLQHISPDYTRRYLAEFIRVLAPGGVLSIQVPESVPAGDPPDRFRFSMWPPTLWMRLKRYVKYHNPGWFPGTPKMQMYAMPRAEVLGTLASLGMRVLAVDRSEHADVVNLTYLAVRPSDAGGK